MKIKVGISARHIHLTKEDYDLLFDEQINIKKEINQPGQYASDKTVTIQKDNKKIENVRILGPFRNYTQVEISRTDARKLGINPPIKDSGDLKEAEEITIISEKGNIKRKACIIATRHIHITPEQRKEYKLNDNIYCIKKEGEKGGILYNVKISENEQSYFELHIDTDDANALGLIQDDYVEIIEKRD